MTRYDNIYQSMLNKPFFICLILLSLMLYATPQPPKASCVSTCYDCSYSNSSYCYSCISGYQLQNNICISYNCPVAYCQSCQSYSICIQCNPTFILFNNTCICQNNFGPSVIGAPNATCICPSPGSTAPSNCLQCQVSGCLSCNSSFVCTQCAIGYISNGIGGCVYCNILNCLSCSSNGFCQQCQSNYSISTTGTCVLCSNMTGGCSMCSYNNTCGICNSGYTLITYYNQSTICVQCFVQNCMSCNTNNVCATCVYNFYKINGSCVPFTNFNCAFPCVSCTSTNCNSCYNPMYSVSLKQGIQCVPCNVPNCQNCNDTNPSVCLACNYGYNSFNNGTICSTKITGCIFTSYQTGLCSYCQNYYTLVNGTCVLCNTPQMCSSCSANNTSMCTGCLNKFYLLNGNCYPCASYCQYCSGSATNCEIFAAAIQINSNYYLAVCPSSCATCSINDPYYCLTCINGYYYNSGSCLACNPLANCQICNASNPNSCLICYPNNLQTLVNGNVQCQVCNYPCLSCFGSLSNCTSCSISYTLLNNTCVNNLCGPYCMICSGNSSCKLCIPGFYAVNGNGNCLPCIAGCQTCAINNPLVCLSCTVGTALNLNGACLPCPNNCMNCFMTGKCTQCFPNYYLTVNNDVACAPKCQSPCSACTYENPSLCFSCQAGYIFSLSAANYCQLYVNCSQNFSCTVCPQGYARNSNQQCIKCGINCITCNFAAINNCTSCAAGYFLNQTTCSQCQAGCLNCTSPLGCLTCANGFAAVMGMNQIKSNNFQTPICQPCVAPCLTCYGLVNYCLSCMSGYQIVGGACLSNLNYQFSITLSTNYSTFIQNYNMFVNQLVTVLNNTSIGNLLISGGSQIPVQINGYLSSQCPPQSGCAQTEANNLQQLINSSFIANMSIVNGFFFVNGNTSTPNFTSNCNFPCVSCIISSNSSICQTCALNYTLLNKVCVNLLCQIAYCQSCSSSYVCTQCLPTFFLINNTCVCQSSFGPSIIGSNNASCICPFPGSNISASACILCKIPNCISCSSSFNCTLCLSGYNLNGAGGCSSCLSQNCLSCSANGFCLQCPSGYSVSNTGTCVTCNNVTVGTSCTVCSQNNTCFACNAGYSLMPYNGCQPPCLVQNCYSCYSNGLCNSCQNGYTLNAIAGNCTKSNCVYPCQTCYSNGTCQTCSYPNFSPYPSSSGRCFTCQVAYCILCNQNSTNNCTMCFSGYFVSGGACILQSGNSNCYTYMNGMCSTCAPYFTIINGTCVMCQTSDPKCTFCSSQNKSLCLNCLPGFYLQNNTCYSCPSNCQNCTSPNSCSVYYNNTILISNQYLMYSCYADCLTCASNNPNYCLSCGYGYVYSGDGFCSPCSPLSNCKICQLNGIANCTSCYPGSFMIVNSGLNVCKLCSSPCSTCSLKPTNCTGCAVDYRLVNNTCVVANCGSNCVKCSDSSTCILCMPGFFPQNGNGSCLPCIAGCASCMTTNPYACLSCSPGTVLNPSTQYCQICPNNCYSCLINNVCTKCNSGFYLTTNSNITCAPSCLFPCTACSYTNPALCYSCQAGYIFNPAVANQCQPSLNCSQTFTCVMCPLGYTLNKNQQCVQCGSTCGSCRYYDPMSCTSCPAGTFQNSSSTCSPCFANCAQCANSISCFTCQPGYTGIYSFAMTYTSYASSNTQFPTCVPCTYPCATCNIQTTFCLTCVQGYQLIGTVCLNNFNFEYTFTLNSNFSSFVANYLTFTNTLLNAINSSNIANIFITSGSANPFQITGLVSSLCLPQTNCSQTEYNNLQKIIKGTTIGNMTIVSASLITNGGSVPNNTNNTNTTNNSCAYPCATCNSTTAFCLTCIKGFIFKSNYCLNATCQVLYCQSCLNNMICTKCMPSFILSNGTCICQTNFIATPFGSPNASCLCNPSGKLGSSAKVLALDSCILCKLSGCLNCNTSTNCIECALGYQLTTQGTCVVCNIDYCTSCSLNNFCISCNPGYLVASTGDQCVLCSISNCQVCSANNICKQCVPGYSFDVQNLKCITCSISNCLSCSDNNVCYNCARGYQLSTQNYTCILTTCSYPCSSCNQNGSCSACVSPPFVATPDNNQNCYSCAISNCFNCSLTNLNICLQCVSGYTFNSSISQCVKICADQLCVNCSNNVSICNQCIPTYTSINGSCQSCAIGCLACNSTNQCLNCTSGFYLSNSSCLSCPAYCLDCNSANSCETLNDNNGKTLININGITILALCNQGCAECSSTNIQNCIRCNEGYYLNSNSICQPCTLSSNCKTCNQSNPSQCFTCFANSNIVTNTITTCQFCTFPCITCLPSSPTSCSSCAPGYLLANNKCQNQLCGSYCFVCKAQNNCQQCLAGFTSVNGTCVPCIAGCMICSNSAPGQCQFCSIGTFLSPKTLTCLSCSLNCYSCEANGCQSCFAGYYLSSSLQCAPNCISPCATCSPTNPSLCLSCIAGYTFNSSSNQNCQASLDCSSTSSCSVCPLGFVLNSTQQCVSCNSNCITCQINNLDACTSCPNGQYLNSSMICANCSIGCAICLSSTICLSCSSGFTAANSNSVSNPLKISTDTPLLCVACTSPCATCLLTSQTCVTCLTGFTMVGNKCVSNYNFGFLVTLNANATIFYNNYYNFISAIAQAVNSSDIGIVSVLLINTGSTIVQGTVNVAAAEGSAAANNQFNNLQSQLSSNIANMNVESSSVIANGGTSGSESTSNVTVIVVAVVVPVVVVILIIIGVLIYCKKKKAREEYPSGTTNKSPLTIQLDVNTQKR